MILFFCEYILAGGLKIPMSGYSLSGSQATALVSVKSAQSFGFLFVISL